MANQSTGMQRGVALFNQVLEFVGVSKRPMTEEQAKTAGKALQQVWASQPDRRLTSARRLSSAITTDLRMLKNSGEPEHTLACTFFRELGQDVPQPLEEHPLFSKVMTDLRQAAGIQVA